MKKFIIIIFFFIAIIILFFLILKKKVGDIQPAVLPPKNSQMSPTNTVSSPKIGHEPNIPLHLPSGFTIGVFASNLSDARALTFTPDGSALLVSLTSKGKIVAISDTHQTGTADKVKVLLTGLNNPHGLAFYQGYLYLAEETQLSRFSWDPQNWQLTNQKILFSLPKGGRHFTRSIVFDKSGRLFVTIGSTCDVCIELNPWYAAIIVTDKDGNNPKVFAQGLRNSVFMTQNPQTNEIWATEMGRDWLGDETPPDEINIVKQGGDYGWPYCYGNRIYDKNFGQNSPSYCQNTIAPIYQIPAHSAPLGLTFINSSQFPSDWQGDLLVAYHGSWNRSTPTGYKVVHLKIKDNQIINAEDFISGFLEGDQALARPVDLIFDQEGSLYISDDKGGFIFKVVKN